MYKIFLGVAMKKLIVLVLVLIPIGVKAISLLQGEPILIQPNKQDIEIVQDYLADCFDKARQNNFDFSEKDNIPTVIYWRLDIVFT